jgi:hypothetical protein
MKCSPFLSASVLLATLCIVATACGAQDIPSGVPAQLAKAWKNARSDWTMEAQLAQAIFTRTDAKSEFQSDIVFMAASRQKLYHIKDGPKGHVADEETYRYMPTLTARVIDLPQAVDIARKSGMKGNVVTAQLALWIFHNTTTAVEVWRLEPDNDPNTQDPNDPHMKNYFIDALTGTPYDYTAPDGTALAKGSEAMVKAVSDDMAEFVQSLKR